MKDSKQKAVHYFFYKNNFKGTMRFTGKQNRIRTVNAEISTKNSLSKFGKQKFIVINKYQEINNLQGEV